MSLNAGEAMDRRAVGVLSAGHLCIDLCQGAIPAFLPFLLIERHLSYTAAAGLVLAANMASSVVQPVFGHLADRYSTPWLMPLGLVVAGTGLALAGFAPSYLLIALSVALSGIGIAAFHPEAARLMNAVAGKKRATGMSIFSIGGSLGFAIGPLLTTALLLLLGLGGASLLLVPEVALAIVLIVHFSRFALYSSKSSQKGRGEQPARPDAWGPFARLTGMIMCRSVIFYGLNTFLPLYWIATLHQSKVAGGTALTVLLAAGIIGTFVGGRMADRYGRRIVVLLALSCLAPLLLAFVLFSEANTALALVLLIPIGFALFAPFSVMVVMGQEYLPNRVGTASGVTLGLAVTVGGITAPLFGHIADLYSVHAALGWLACVPLLAIALAFTLPRTRLSGAQVAASPEQA
ncbi:MAG: MFS transporter [Chloroflexota bacterium]|nr:MFS transporter [Chloroflexota bacterium]